MKITRFYYCFFAIFLSSCQTFQFSNSKEIEASNNEPRISQNFKVAVQSNLKKVEHYYNFETVYQIDGIYFSKEFYELFSKEWNNIFPSTENYFKEFEDKIFILISIYTPNDEYQSLSNTHVWNIYLESNSKQIKPERFKKLYQKETTVLFFPFVNKWTNEYILAFNRKEVNLGESEKIKIVLSNPDASAKISW